MTLCECKYSSPSNICFVYLLIRFSFNAPYYLIKLDIDPPNSQIQFISDFHHENIFFLYFSVGKIQKKKTSLIEKIFI